MKIRPVEANDSRELCSLLNEIIVIGGTTAIEEELKKYEFEEYFVNGKDCVHTILALERKEYLGFQCLSYHPELPENWLDIATFTRARPKTRGAGTALFGSIVEYASQNKFSYINATIRADNQAGLAYYTKMGFQKYSVVENVPLKDGTTVDRISKKYKLE